MITMSWYLEKIVETHLEIIKDRGIVLVNFQGYLSFSFGCHFRFWRKKKWKPFFAECSCIKCIRSKVKLYITEISHGKYTVSCTRSNFYLTEHSSGAEKEAVQS